MIRHYKNNHKTTNCELFIKCCVSVVLLTLTKQGLLVETCDTRISSFHCCHLLSNVSRDQTVFSVTDIS